MDAEADLSLCWLHTILLSFFFMLTIMLSYIDLFSHALPHSVFVLILIVFGYIPKIGKVQEL